MRILFVEDEVDIREVVEIALGLDAGFQVTAFASGVEALEILADRGETFQYALLNMRLPAMTGVELHEALRRLPGMANIASIIISAAERKWEVEALGVPGIAGIIAKPFDPLTLAANVRAMFADHAAGKSPRIMRPG